jgi:hypothetical protein
MKRSDNAGPMCSGMAQRGKLGSASFFYRGPDTEIYCTVVVSFYFTLAKFSNETAFARDFNASGERTKAIDKFIAI